MKTTNHRAYFSHNKPSKGYSDNKSESGTKFLTGENSWSMRFSHKLIKMKNSLHFKLSSATKIKRIARQQHPQSNFHKNSSSCNVGPYFKFTFEHISSAEVKLLIRKVLIDVFSSLKRRNIFQLNPCWSYLYCIQICKYRLGNVFAYDTCRRS